MTTREDEKISFYIFPRDVRSHNVYTKNCLVQKRTTLRERYANTYTEGHCGNF